MNILEIALFTIGGIYVLFNIILTAGVAAGSKSVKSENGKNKPSEPNVSVIVPARNEEQNIKRCLDSLEALDYPEDKLEIVIIDDNSDDNTASIVQNYCDRIKHFSLLSLNGSSESTGANNTGASTKNTGAGGKIAALKYGYQETSGDIILQTDADCAVPSGWIKTITSIMDKEVGIVGGAIMLDEYSKRNSWITRILSLAWLYLLGVGAGANGAGFPLSCFGNNLAVRRTAYEDAGGYDAIPFTFTEDFALFKSITRAGWRSSFSLKNTSVILSRPPDSLRNFINQRLRWATGGIKLAGPGIILLIAAFLLHLLVIAAVAFNISLSVLVTVIIVTGFSDFIFLATLTNKVNKSKLLLYFPLFEVYFFLSTTLFGLALPFVSSLKWKDRKYR